MRSFERQKFVKYFSEFCDKLVLNEKFLKSLRESFPLSMDSIENVLDERKKEFIILELTKERHSCNKLIQLLQESGDESNKTIAEQMMSFSKSSELCQFSDDIEIGVTPTQDTKDSSSYSLVYPMTRKPRGKAIIINNVREEVQRESQRFEYIFKQLLFDVELVFDLTADEMIAKLTQIKDDINKEYDESDGKLRPEALIVMVISHGMDEIIYGKGACSDSHSNNQVNVDNIVNIYSFENFNFDETFVKMFFFACCRDQDNELTSSSSTDDKPSSVLITRANNNEDTMVFYSCANSYEGFRDDNCFYTYFGRYLSETIAQFAYKEDLAQIIDRVCCALREKWGSLGYFTPENKLNALKSSVYFNPGWFQQGKI